VITGVFVETRHFNEMQVAYLDVKLKLGLLGHGLWDDNNVTESILTDGYCIAVHGKLNFLQPGSKCVDWNSEWNADI
jgi:hypothetical protein